MEANDSRSLTQRAMDHVTMIRFGIIWTAMTFIDVLMREVFPETNIQTMPNRMTAAYANWVAYQGMLTRRK